MRAIQSYEQPSARLRARTYEQQALAHGLEPLEARQFLSVTTDDQGWTVFGRSADTRIVYVSSSGGNDANSGLSEDAPVKTLAKAKTLLRNGAPDWMLLKRGDAWSENLTSWRHSGRSAEEMLVVGAYGTGARPKLNTGTQPAFSHGGSPLAHLAIVGVHFHAHTRDTALSTYAGVTGGSNGFASIGNLANVLIEDAVFDEYEYNFNLAASATAPITDFTLRRSIVTDAWSIDGRAQGMYADHVHGLVLEGNVFDHNGWNDAVPGAGANVYSHGVYMSSRNSGVVLRGNLISDSSSHGVQARSGGVIENNAFLRNPINLLVGGGSPTVTPGGVVGRVVGNVFLDSRSIAGSGRGTGIDLANIRPGGGSLVADNIFTADAHRISAAISFGTTSDATNVNEAVGINDVLFTRNIVYDWHSAWNMSTAFKLGGTGNTAVNDVRVEGNDFQNTAISRIVRHGPPANVSELYWGGNRYDSTFASSGWFEVNGTTTSYDTWRSTVEPTAVRQAGAYADPARSIAAYNVTLGGDAAFGDFLTAARAQDRRTLDGRYTAAAIVNYVRSGFTENGVVPAGGLLTTYGPRIADTTPTGGAASNPADNAGPTATLTAAPANLLAPGTAPVTFTVTYADATAVDLNTIASGDVRVTLPNGSTQSATFISRATTNNGKTVVTVYGAPAPGGYWDAGDGGTYAIELLPGGVRDTLGNDSAAAAFGTFNVDVPVDGDAPGVAAAAIPNIAAAGTAPQTFTLTYTDATAVDLATIGTGDVLVNTPAGGVVPASYVTRTVSNDGRTVVAQYALAAPGGYWDVDDSGAYAVSFASGGVADVLGQASAGAALGSFTVNIAAEDTAAPTAALTAATLTSGGIAPYTFTVTFNDATAVDAASIGAGDVIVTEPGGGGGGGGDVPVTYVGQQSSNNGRTIVATFSVAAPGSYWDEADDGAYDVSLPAGAARDILGNASAAKALGSFTVNVPPDSAAPAAALSVQTVNAGGTTSHAFTVTYTDATGVDAGSVGNGDVTVTGPASYSQSASLVSKQTSADGKTVTAVYSITAPGDEWDYFDNGTYTARINSDAVRDLGGNGTASATVGTFTARILDSVAPVASLSASDVTSSGTTPHPFTITYEDDIGLNAASVGAGDVLVTAPDGADYVASLVSKQTSADGRTVIASYTVAAPGGAWDGADNGTYRVALASAQVSDLSGNAAAVGAIGTFAVYVAGADTVAPTASLSATNVTAEKTAAHTFTVTYTDDTAIDVSGVGAGGVTVTGPAGYSQQAAVVSKTASSAAAVVVTYSVPAPGGAWDAADNGTYAVALAGNSVFDAAGNPAAAAALGSFAVAIADTTPPVASLSATNVTSAGGASHTFTVTYADAVGVNVSTIGNGDATVTGPNGYSQAGAFVSQSSPDDGKTVSAVYSVPAADGTWDAADNGTYNVALAAGAVTDTAGNATAAAALGSFTVNVSTSTTTTVTLGTNTSAYVRNGNQAKKSFGTASDLQVRTTTSSNSTTETYVRFDIASLTTVFNAKLRLNGRLSASGSVPVAVYGSPNTTWTEGGLTWNSRPATNTAALATRTLTSTTYGWHEWDVTTYLQQLKAAGATAVTFVLKGTTNTSVNATFRSDEYSTAPDRPQLVVTQDSAPTPPPAPALTVSKTLLTAPEGGSGTFTVQLSSAPASDVTVTVARQSGDADLSAAPATLVFTPVNWATPQTVTVAAAQDTDTLNGQAVFAVASSGMTTRTVTATEADDDVPAPAEPVTVSSTNAAYVRDGTSASTNFGSATELIVKRSFTSGNTREAYLTFDLGSVSTIGSAKLRLHGKLAASVSVSGSVTTDVYSSTNTSWSESTVTWNTKPTTGTTKLGSITVSGTTDRWYELDLTSFLKAELAAGRKVVTLALKAPATTDPWITFASDDAAANAPQVVVTP